MDLGEECHSSDVSISAHHDRGIRHLPNITDKVNFYSYKVVFARFLQCKLSLFSFPILFAKSESLTQAHIIGKGG